jgi:hypothetical protein
MLTDAQVRAAKAGDSPRKLFDERGLYLHVMPNGGKYWRFNYRFKGKHRTRALGVYLDVPLAKARAATRRRGNSSSRRSIHASSSRSRGRRLKTWRANGMAIGRQAGTSGMPTTFWRAWKQTCFPK